MIPLPDSSIWDSQSEWETFRKYVGTTYSSLEEALEAKSNEASYIKEYLNLSKTDKVMDLGSGYGFIAYHLAQSVDHVYCVDVSETFLSKCEKVNEEHTNVSCHLIERASFEKFSNIDAIYCVAVFIHFNIYDVVTNLTGLHNVLKPGGKLLFDFYDADYLDYNDSVFQRHIQRYRENRDNLLTIINFNSKAAVINIAENIGFAVSVMHEGKQPMFLLTKI